jgi:hypothetical protein
MPSCRCPVPELARLLQSNVTASRAETRLELLDTQVEMVKDAAPLMRHQRWRARPAAGYVAIAFAQAVPSERQQKLGCMSDEVAPRERQPTACEAPR